jgi:hypothetical protein
MMHAYRLLSLQSPHAPPTLWEWERSWMHHLMMNAGSFYTAAVEQRYCRDWEALHREHARMWDVHSRSRPVYDHRETWGMWWTQYRQLSLDVQERAGDV